MCEERIPIRRKDREVTDINAIKSIIGECEIIRIGLCDGDYPYIVPVNFAYAEENGRLSFYIHGAMAGRKYALMQSIKKCSFEMDIPIALECIPEKKDVTMRYKSVMGKADIVFLEGEEKLRAIEDIIMVRHKETENFEYNKNALPRTAVARLDVTELTAKANLPSGGPDRQRTSGRGIK